MVGLLLICIDQIMQICMKLGQESSAALAEVLETQRKAAGLSYAALGRRAKVHPSQASRICRGEFSTLSGSVVQICSVLKIDPGSPKLRDAKQAKPAQEEQLVQAAAQSVLALWNGTPDGAKRVVRLLEAIAALAKPTGA